MRGSGKGIFVTCGMIMSYMVLAWLTVHFFPSFLVGFFTSDKALAEIAAPALKLFFAGFFMMGFMFCGQGRHSWGWGLPKQAIFFSLLRKVVIVVPLTILLPYFMGVEGVFVAEPVSNYIGGIASFGTMLLTVMPILLGKKQKI